MIHVKECTNPQYSTAVAPEAAGPMLSVMSFNMEIRQAGAELINAMLQTDRPMILFTQEDLIDGESRVNEGIVNLMVRRGSQIKFRGGKDFPLEGYSCIAESKAETADWLDQTEGLLSGMHVSNKIYVREDIKSEFTVLSTCSDAGAPVPTLGDLLKLEKEVPPRSACWACVRYLETTFMLTSVHLSGGRFDDSLIKDMIGDPAMASSDLEKALTVKATQLNSALKQVFDMCHDVHLLRSQSDVIQKRNDVTLMDMVKEKQAREAISALPPIDFMIVGGDCNSYAGEVTSLHNEKNPQFGYATGVLFGPYKDAMKEVDAFLKYQTVPDAISNGEWTLARQMHSNRDDGPHVRSSIYGGIVDHFFLYAAPDRVTSHTACSTVGEDGLQRDAESGKYARLASDHNPITLSLSWKINEAKKGA